MCGRYTYFPAEFADLRVRWNLEGDPPFFANRYNICPGQNVPVVIQARARNRLGAMRWGLIPSWAKDEKIGYKMINARVETLTEKPSFRWLVESRRCLILSNGFYEWRKDGTRKAPVFIYLKTKAIFAFAGLWELWHKADGERLASCTILTCGANELMAPIHNRMPVILQPSDESKWLDVAHAPYEPLQPILASYPADLMSLHEVSTMVNAPANNRPECISPNGY